MNKLILSLIICLILSCQKEEPAKPDDTALPEETGSGKPGTLLRKIKYTNYSSNKTLLAVTELDFTYEEGTSKVEKAIRKGAEYGISGQPLRTFEYAFIFEYDTDKQVKNVIITPRIISPTEPQITLNYYYNGKQIDFSRDTNFTFSFFDYDQNGNITRLKRAHLEFNFTYADKLLKDGRLNVQQYYYTFGFSKYKNPLSKMAPGVVAQIGQNLYGMSTEDMLPLFLQPDYLSSYTVSPIPSIISLNDYSVLSSKDGLPLKVECIKGSTTKTSVVIEYEYLNL